MTYLFGSYNVIIRSLNGVGGGLSLLVVVSFVSFKNLRNASGHYSLWVALANILNAIFVMMDGKQGSLQCEFSGFGRTYANFVSLAVSIIIANRMYSLFQPPSNNSNTDNSNNPFIHVFNKIKQLFIHQAPSTQESSSHISMIGSNEFSKKEIYRKQLRIGLIEFYICWLVPIIFTAIPWMQGQEDYGKPNNGEWCWINQTGWNNFHYLFLFYYIPLWFTIIYTCYIYGHLYIQGYNRILMSNSNVVQGQAVTRLHILINKLKWYPFNLTFCNLFPTLSKILKIGFNYNNYYLDIISKCNSGCILLFRYYIHLCLVYLWCIYCNSIYLHIYLSIYIYTYIYSCSIIQYPGYIGCYRLFSDTRSYTLLVTIY